MCECPEASISPHSCPRYLRTSVSFYPQPEHRAVEGWSRHIDLELLVGLSQRMGRESRKSGSSWAADLGLDTLSSHITSWALAIGVCVCVGGGRVFLVSEACFLQSWGSPTTHIFQCSCNPGLEMEEPRGPPWHLLGQALCQTQGLDELMGREPVCQWLLLSVWH